MIGIIMLQESSINTASVNALPDVLALTQSLPQTPTVAELTFLHTLSIYLKDSNAYGNTYFARYFEWQGICRERWFFECIARDMLQGEGVFITKHAQQDYLQETFPFQEVHCELNAYGIRRCSFWLEFRFFADGKPVSVGRQQIVFAGHDKQIKALPPQVLKSIARYAMSGK
jgi:enediyne biosynthesis thioesterase